MIAASSPLRHRSFRRLFAAQILSLVGIGVMTVSLSLDAFATGGIQAGGLLLGGILALKMVAYVLVAPLAEVLLARLPRRPTLVGIDLLRLGLVAAMGFAVAPWQIMVLAFVFFAVSSGFTPLFQSVLPDLLPDEAVYARALALSRLAYTVESLLSPILAAAALRLVTADQLYFLASACLAGSALTLLATRFPEGMVPRKAPFLRRLSRGLRIYALTPRLRGVFLMNLALSLALAWVLVNTVVFAGARLGEAEQYYTRLMACYGGGAALGALSVPRLLAGRSERGVMALGLAVFAALGLTLPLLPTGQLLPLGLLWAGFGAASSLVLTPGGLVLARSAARADRPAVFAAQFSLSHAGWLLAYPLAGALGAWLAPEPALALLCLLSLGVTALALRVWPAEDPLVRPHAHPDLPADHPHLRAHPAGAGRQHEHDFHIDDLHPHWPQTA